MKLLVYSQKAKQEKNVGWYRAGEEISYFPNGMTKSSLTCKPLFTLHFAYTFEYADDYVWFAYNYPYTYTQLVEFLNKIESDRATSEYFLYYP